MTLIHKTAFSSLVCSVLYRQLKKEGIDSGSVVRSVHSSQFSMKQLNICAHAMLSFYSLYSMCMYHSYRGTCTYHSYSYAFLVFYGKCLYHFTHKKIEVCAHTSYKARDYSLNSLERMNEPVFSACTSTPFHHPL